MALNTSELTACEQVATELASFAAREMVEHRPSPEERSTKTSPHDWVTVVDVDIERHVRERLRAAFPHHAIVGEEFGQSGDLAGGGPVWYVDPIDGTTNFVHGLPWSSFSIALAEEGSLILGIVSDPYRSETFSASRGQGARLNGVPISCADRPDLMGGAVLTELAGVHPWPGLTEMIVELGRRGCVTRIMGSSALSLASVAAGRAAGVVLGGFHPIDVSAGVVIAREAGAEICAGNSADAVFQAGRQLRRGALVAAVPGVVDGFVELLEALPTTLPLPVRASD